MPTSRPWLSTITSREPSSPRKQLVVGLLDAGLAHHVAWLVGGIARVVQHVFAHFAHIADQVRCKAVARIEPALLVDGFQLRQLVAVRLNEGLLVRRDFLLDGDGLIARGGAEVLHGGAQLVEIEIKAARNHGQIGIDVVVLLAHQEAGNRRIVVDDQAVFAVEELAARRQHGHLANAVLLREHAEVGSAQHLQAPQPRGQRQHHQQDAVLHRRQLNAGDFFAACCFIEIHGSAFSEYSESGSGYSHPGTGCSYFGASLWMQAPTRNRLRSNRRSPQSRSWNRSRKGNAIKAITELPRAM